MTSIRFEPEIEKRLSNLAAMTGRTKTFYLKKLVEDHLDDLEDQYLALHRLEHPHGFMTLDEVIADNGLDSKV